MKKIVTLIIFLVGFNITYCQLSTASEVQIKCDSILNLLITEKNPDKKAELIISFYSTSIDGFPLLLLNLSQQLLVAAKQNKDIFTESAALSASAQGYRLTGNYVKALEMHRKAVALAEQAGNKILLGFAINQMGHIYKDRQENQKALSLYRDAFSCFESAGKNNIWYASMNISTIYFNMGNYDSSLFYANKGLNQITKNPGVGNYSILYANIAGIYSYKKSEDSVRKYFMMAINSAMTIQSGRYLNSVYGAMAEFFEREKQYDSATIYYKKAINVVAGTEMSNWVIKPAKKLIAYYQNINSDSAMKYWKIYSAANDSVNSIRTNQQIQQLTFEEEERKRDIELAKLAYQNKIRIGLLLGGLGVLSVIGFILYHNNRQKQKANKVLERTLSDLKSTQSQLVQSEKMASLGELTAGIAHEIQNPLNFVNNFSELNVELIEELRVKNEELGVKDADLTDLLNDIKTNSEKINHHGKRADGIVKGMLQHSRSSTGQKEPTDINALCDEYLRLAYHGLRAKDKTFNAEFKTEFDETIGKVNVQPQEMGRVILNLINNAFYACTERSRSAAQLGDTSYEPRVTVRTKQIPNPANPQTRNIAIAITDNGTGIPQHIKEKIFQPFFTTKPTGQGTGLGLSLAYDIVTKVHSGKLEVDSEEGKGTTFIVTIPV